MTCVGVVGALAPEVRALVGRRLRGGSVQRVPNGLSIAISGIGRERAHEAGKRLIDAGATALVSWGSAAALDCTLAPGTLLLPTEVIARTGTVFTVDIEWQRRLHERLNNDLAIYTGALVESPRTLASAAEKSALAKRSGAAAADMESAALAALAHDMRIPFIVVRAIADGARVAVPVRFADAVRSDGTLQVASSLGWLAFSPWHWPTALRLAWGFRAALATLSRVAREFRACAPAPNSALSGLAGSGRGPTPIDSTVKSVLSPGS